MSKEAKHSQLPWTAEDCIVICEKGDFTVALCENDSHLTIPEEEANAKFIAKACNCHQFLVDALKELITIQDQLVEGHPNKVIPFFNRVFQRGRQAVMSAEAE